MDQDAAVGSAPHDVNSYIIEHIPRATPYMSLLQDIMPQKVGNKSSKQHLSLLRELCVYASAQSPNVEVFVALTTTIAACPDLDVERKIIRTCLHILAEMLISDNKRVIDAESKRQMWQILMRELDHANGSRQVVGWRMAGQLCSLLGAQTYIIDRVQQQLDKFQLPTKPGRWSRKAARKEYEEQLYTTAAKLSALRRSGCISVRKLAPLVLASCSDNSDIARHALALLATYAKAVPQEVMQALGSKLGPIDSFEYTEGNINTTDTLCCIYMLRLCEQIAMDPKATIPPQTAHICYMCIAHSLRDSRLRVQLEAVKVLTNGKPSWLQKDASEKNVHNLNVLELITATLETGLSSTTTTLELMPLMRACVMLGRFVVCRPRNENKLEDILDSPRSSTIGSGMKSASRLEEPLLDIFASLSVPTLTPSSTMASTRAPPPVAILSPAPASNVIQVGHSSSFDVDKRFNDLTKYIFSVFHATASSHLKCEALKALLWLAPEVRTENEDLDRSYVWSWIQRRLEESRSQLSEELLGGVMRHAVGRMCETPFYSPPMVQLVLHMGEVFFRRGPSAALCGILVQCWTMAVSFGSVVAEPLLQSILNCLDMLAFPIDVPVEDMPVDAAVQSAEASSSVDNLRRYCYWCLGEYLHLWGERFAPSDTVFTVMRPISDSTVSHASFSEDSGPVLLPTVILRLQNGLWFEDYQTRLICAQALSKLAVRVKSWSIKSYIYAVLHEAQISHTDESVEHIPQPIIYNKRATIANEMLELLHATSSGPQFGLERVLWPAMTALDEIIPKGESGRPDQVMLPLVDTSVTL